MIESLFKACLLLFIGLCKFYIGITLLAIHVCLLPFRMLAAHAANGDNVVTPARRSRYVSQAVQHAVFRRDGGSCLSCGATDNLQYDHAVPYSRGGSSDFRNIQLLCAPCNRRKGATTWKGF